MKAACELKFAALLFDTFVKDGSSLLDWISLETLKLIRHRLGDVGVKVAFAGALDEDRIRQLSTLAPDWFAVRGAACTGGRNGTICSIRVRALKNAIQSRQADPVAS